MKNELYFFLNDYCVKSGKDFGQIVRYYQLQLLLGKEFKNVDSAIYNEYLFLYYVQKRKNEHFIKVINLLIKECLKKKIHPVFLKGYFLACDLYEDINIRSSGDIDILIAIDEFEDIHAIMLQNGFEMESHAGNKNTDIEGIKKEVEFMHISYKKKIDKMQVLVEVHGSIINPSIIFLNKTEIFLKNACENIIGELPVWTLNIDSNLVYLMLHFFKHLPLSFFENALFGKETRVNLQNLNDIAYLVKKYKNNISWYDVINISVQMQVVKPIIIVTKLIIEIYGQIFPVYFLTELYEKKEYTYISQGEYEYYGLGKFSRYFSLYVEEFFDCISLYDILTHKLSIKDPLLKLVKNPVNYFNKKENVKKTIRKLIDGRESIFYLNARSEELIFKIDLEVLRKKCSAYKNEGPLYDKDGLELIVVTKNQIMHRMFTIAYKEETGYYMEISSCNSKDIGEHTDKSTFKYDICVKEDGFLVKIDYVFNELSTVVDDVLFFNIAVLIANPLTDKLWGTETMLGNDKSIWNLSSK